MLGPCEGRVVGAATVARLHADRPSAPTWQAVESSWAPFAGSASPASRDCAAESAALARWPARGRSA